jgi:hypothetical protein
MLHRLLTSWPERVPQQTAWSTASSVLAASEHTQQSPIWVLRLSQREL